MRLGQRFRRKSRRGLVEDCFRESSRTCWRDSIWI